jgi:hypothetical protein
VTPPRNVMNVLLSQDLAALCKAYHKVQDKSNHCKYFSTITLAITSLVLVENEIQHKGGFLNNLKESYSKIESIL